MLQAALSIMDKVSEFGWWFFIFSVVLLNVSFFGMIFAGANRFSKKTCDYFMDLTVFTMKLFAISIPFVLVPSTADLYKIRIGLLKRHMATPANFDRSVAEMENIAKRLEAKYLKCGR